MEKVDGFVAKAIAGVVFIAVLLLVFNELGGFGPLTLIWESRLAEAEAQRLQAQADVMEQRRAMAAQYPLIIASAKDSVLVFIFSLCNWLLLIVFGAAVVLSRYSDNDSTRKDV